MIFNDGIVLIFYEIFEGGSSSQIL